MGTNLSRQKIRSLRFFYFITAGRRCYLSSGRLPRYSQPSYRAYSTSCLVASIPANPRQSSSTKMRSSVVVALFSVLATTMAAPAESMADAADYYSCYDNDMCISQCAGSSIYIDCSASWVCRSYQHRFRPGLAVTDNRDVPQCNGGICVCDCHY